MISVEDGALHSRRQPRLSCTVLVPCWGVEGGEDVFGFGGQGIGGCEVVSVEVDGDVLEGFEDADDAFDADPGGVLDVAGYGQGGHHHGQVGPSGLTGVVEDGAGSQVVPAHPERRTGRATARGRRRRPHRHPSDARKCW